MRGAALSDQIPQADPARRLSRYRGDIELAIRRVLDSGFLLLGPETAAFEEEFAQYLGSSHAVAVGSGAAAITIAVSALGIGVGDEVIVPALTAVPTAGAVRRAGAVPVFVDVNPVTRNIDPGAIESAIGPRTAAILPVHLHGTPAAMQDILAIAARRNLPVIEDCAQAHGASISGRKLGNFGTVAAFSFYPTKNLGAAGDAGAIVTANPEVAKRARRMRSHGLDHLGLAVELGETGRMDEIQAAILRVMLPHLDAANADRRRIADRFRTAMSGLPLDLPPADPGAVYHQFAVLVPQRDRVRTRMQELGVSTGVHYPLALHRHPVFAQPGLQLPVTDDLCARLLSLPIQPEVAEGRIERIVDVLRRSLEP